MRLHDDETTQRQTTDASGNKTNLHLLSYLLQQEHSVKKYFFTLQPHSLPAYFGSNNSKSLSSCHVFGESQMVRGHGPLLQT
jgi:hypothetical protein